MQNFWRHTERIYYPKTDDCLVGISAPKKNIYPPPPHRHSPRCPSPSCASSSEPPPLPLFSIKNRRPGHLLGRLPPLLCPGTEKNPRSSMAATVCLWVPENLRGILIFKWSGCLTVCELCCVPTSCPVYCLALQLPVSPPPQKSTSKICKLLPVVTSNVEKQRHQIRNQGFPKPGFSCSCILGVKFPGPFLAGNLLH